jgi:hypothetical protein
LGEQRGASVISDLKDLEERLSTISECRL